jgi:hypothetical protein
MAHTVVESRESSSKFVLLRESPLISEVRVDWVSFDFWGRGFDFGSRYLTTIPRDPETGLFIAARAAAARRKSHIYGFEDIKQSHLVQES